MPLERRHLHVGLWIGLAGLFGALFGSPCGLARADCVQLTGDLPAALAGCATDRLVCQSYARALAADGGDDESAALLPLQVRLRGAPAAGAGPDLLAFELDVSAAGRRLGQRTLSVRARDCAALPEALALVLVLLAREAGPASAPPIAAEAAPAAPPPAATRLARKESGGSRSLELGAGAGVFFGALPAAALGLHVQASSVSEPVAFRLRATFLWAQERRVEEGYVQMRDYELAAEACAGAQFRNGMRLALRLCAGPRLGLVHARAREFALRNERATELALYVGLMPEISLALGPASWLRLGAAGAVALVRPRFGVSRSNGERLTPLASPSWLRAEITLSLVQMF